MAKGFHHPGSGWIAAAVVVMSLCGAGCAQKSATSTVPAAVVQGGEYRLYGKTYLSRQVTDTPALVVVLHGDAPRHEPEYQYIFAGLVAGQNTDVVAIGLLRPGYTDPEGHTSDGVRGLTTGDNYNARNVDSIAAAIGALERQWHARKVVVVGHSGGSAITANILGRHPELIDGAVIVSCPCDVVKWRAHMYEVQGWSGWLDEIDTVSPIDVLPDISARVPVRMLVGTADDVTPPSLSVAYQAAANNLGKNVTLTQLQGVDHEALFDSAVFAAIAELAKP